MMTIPELMPAEFDYQLNQSRLLSMEAFRLATPLEMKAAGMAMGIISDTGVFVFNSEDDQNKLIEWTIYHIRRQGKSLVQILLEQMPANTDATQLAILTAMANSSWGIYQINEQRPGVGAVVTDRWRGTVHLLYSRALHQSTRIGDYLLARIFVVGEITTMAVLISNLGTEFIKLLQQLQSQCLPSDAILAQNGAEQEGLALTVFKNRSTPRSSQSESDFQLVRSGRPAKQRNQPCPCGSGRKFKVCCGR